MLNSKVQHENVIVNRPPGWCCWYNAPDSEASQGLNGVYTECPVATVLNSLHHVLGLQTGQQLGIF